MSNKWTSYYQNANNREVRELLTLVLSKLSVNPVGLRAIDLGCGDGTESLHLLSQGWKVTAIDAEESAIQLLRSRTPESGISQLQTQVASFLEATYHPVNLIYAGFSLPFCPPEHFASVWHKILTNLKPNAYLAVNLFGMDDEWHGQPGMTFHSEADINTLSTSLTLEHFKEIRETRETASGSVKRWHAYEIIARKPG